MRKLVLITFDVVVIFIVTSTADYEWKDSNANHKFRKPYFEEKNLRKRFFFLLPLLAAGTGTRTTTEPPRPYIYTTLSTTTTTQRPESVKTETLTCPNGTYVREVHIRNGLEVDCFAPGDTRVHTLKFITPTGNARLSECPAAMRGIQFTVNNYTLDAFGICNYNERSNYPSASSCRGADKAVCGITVMYKARSKTLIEGSVECCQVLNPASTCTPKEHFELIFEYDNTRSGTNVKYVVQERVGMVTSKSSSSGQSSQADFYSNFFNNGGSTVGKQRSDTKGQETSVGANVGVSFGPVQAGINANHAKSTSNTVGFSSELSNNFGKNIGKSRNTGFNWQTTSANEWSQETTTVRDVDIPAGIRTVIEQLVGTCGFLSVRTKKLRESQFDKNGNTYLDVEDSPPQEAPQKPTYKKKSRRGKNLIKKY